jgi:large subunit ribosomal protein L22
MNNMEAKAIANTVRITPRKARLVIDLIRGKDIKEAQAILMFTPRAASPIILKVLNSAVANATNNLNLESSNLYVKSCFVNEGVVMKRMMPRAKGSGDIIKKRTSHITVVVAEREEN